jgi:two-component system phosphate regulon response regulator PhoB
MSRSAADPESPRRSRVLIADDNEPNRELLEVYLTDIDCDIATAVDGKDTLDKVAEFHPDVILLDVMMPKLSGFEVCQRLKADPATRRGRVIITSGLGGEIDRVVGFELGADDYVTKPFSVRELILRIRAVLRRSDPEGAAEDAITFGRLKVDRTAHRVYVDGAEVVLTALEFRLLSTLIDRRNRVQSRDALLADVWGLQMHVETRTVDTHIKRLREKLGVAGEYIHTVRGVGYRFASDPGDPGG